MNSGWLDDELSEIDKEPESWSGMLSNMFDDGEIEVIDVNDGEELEVLE